MSSWKAELMLLLMTIIWGATFLFTKIGLDATGPYFYLVLRFSLAVALTFIFFFNKLNFKDKQLIKNGIILGSIFGIGFILQTKGLEFTSIQKSAFITGLTVVLTPFTFKLLTKKKVLLFSKIGVVIAFIGLYIFTDPDFSDINKGDVYTFLSTFCWATFIPLLDKFTNDNNTPNLTINLVFLQLSSMLIVVTSGFFIFEFNNFYIDWNYNLVQSVLFNGVVASFILMFIHTNFQKHTTPVKAALIFSLEPIFAALFAFMFLNEFLSSTESLGASILFFGVLTSELGLPILNLIKNKN